MNAVTFEFILQKCGAEALCQAIIVCLASAILKKRYNLGKRLQTAAEVAASFVVAGAVAFLFGNGDYSNVVTSGLETAGVALAVCGFICGDGKSNKLNENAVDVIVNLKSNEIEDIKSAILSLPDLNFSESEAEAIAQLASKLKEKKPEYKPSHRVKSV